MEFFRNFYKDDDKIIGLCAFRKRKPAASNFEFERKFGASKLIYEPKMRANMFLY